MYPKLREHAEHHLFGFQCLLIFAWFGLDELKSIITFADKH